MDDAREQLRQGIHGYFAEFGTETCDTVFDAIVGQGSVAAVLQRLGLLAPKASDAQYLALLEYLRANGPQEFLHRLHSASRDSRSSTTGIRYERVRAKLIAQSLGKGGETPKPVKQVPRPAAPLPSNPPERAPGVPPASSALRAAAPVSASDAEDSMRSSSAGLPMPRHDPSFDPVAEVLRQSKRVKKLGLTPEGQWDGVTERRSGKDRRSGKERREEVEAVQRNKRFGGERRKRTERRKNWPPKA